MHFYEIFFSPTGGTKKVADALSAPFQGNVTKVDLIKNPRQIRDSPEYAHRQCIEFSALFPCRKYNSSGGKVNRRRMRKSASPLRSAQNALWTNFPLTIVPTAHPFAR